MPHRYHAHVPDRENGPYKTLTDVLARDQVIRARVHGAVDLAARSLRHGDLLTWRHGSELLRDICRRHRSLAAVEDRGFELHGVHAVRERQLWEF